MSSGSRETPHPIAAKPESRPANMLEELAPSKQAQQYPEKIYKSAHEKPTYATSFFNVFREPVSRTSKRIGSHATSAHSFNMG